jgi:hypothetical protein
VNAALGLLQAVDIKTPDTTGHFVMGYAAIGAIFAAYLLFLWIRARNAQQR